MPFVRAEDMQTGRPMQGWSGRFFHSENMTFGIWEIAADAIPVHAHTHPQEEVWHVVAGEVAITIDGEEQIIGPDSVAIVPPGVPHSARPLGAGHAIVADYPLRKDLPGVAERA